MAKGFSRPVTFSSQAAAVSRDVSDAQRQLKAKRKLTRTSRSRAATDPRAQAGDLVEVLVKLDKEKREKWLTPRSVIETERLSDKLAVSGFAKRTLKAAFENVPMALEEDSFASVIQQSINVFNAEICGALDKHEIVSATETTQSTEYAVAADIDKDVNLSPVTLCSGNGVEVF